MKVSLPKALSFLCLIPLLVGLTHALESADTNQAKPYSEVFPSLNDTVSMAHLSNLVYAFGSDKNFTCADFTSDPKIHTEDLSCEWYTHDHDLGTQVLLVSNKQEKYIAVIFAGTDDIMTSLQDANIMTKQFGNNSTRLTEDTDQRSKKARVHSGFNNAVFTHSIWEGIHSKTQELLQKHRSYSLWTTGHSLGGAAAILAAAAFASLNHDRNILSVTFGCPQIGNHYLREYFNPTSPLTNNLGIWRVVLAWDLVPRLPQFFTHVGHTIQIDGKTSELKTYYEHYGDTERKYAGVPTGWYSKSYAWLPYALYYHHMNKYLTYLEEIEPTSWIETFEMHSSVGNNDVYDYPQDNWLVPEGETKLVNPSEMQKFGLRKVVG